MIFCPKIQLPKCWKWSKTKMLIFFKEIGIHFKRRNKEINIFMEKQTYMSGYPWGKLYKYSVLKHFQFLE